MTETHTAFADLFSKARPEYQNIGLVGVTKDALPSELARYVAFSSVGEQYRDHPSIKLEIETDVASITRLYPRCCWILAGLRQANLARHLLRSGAIGMIDLSAPMDDELLGLRGLAVSLQFSVADKGEHTFIIRPDAFADV